MSTDTQTPDALSKLKIIVERIEGFEREMKALGADALTEGAAALFEAHPKLDSFSWHQYTPYFNDGDPCEFRVSFEADGSDIRYDGYLLSRYADVEDDEGNPVQKHPLLENADYSWSRPRTSTTSEAAVPADAKNLVAEMVKWVRDGERKKYTFDNPGFIAEIGTVVNDISQFVNAFPESLLQSVIGDHVSVTIRRAEDGSIVRDIEDYDHD